MRCICPVSDGKLSPPTHRHIRTHFGPSQKRQDDDSSLNAQACDLFSCFGEDRASRVKIDATFEFYNNSARMELPETERPQEFIQLLFLSSCLVCRSVSADLNEWMQFLTWPVPHVHFLHLLVTSLTVSCLAVRSDQQTFLGYFLVILPDSHSLWDQYVHLFLSAN